MQLPDSPAQGVGHGGQGPQGRGAQRIGQGGRGPGYIIGGYGIGFGRCGERRARRGRKPAGRQRLAGPQLAARGEQHCGHAQAPQLLQRRLDAFAWFLALAALRLVHPVRPFQHLANYGWRRECGRLFFVQVGFDEAVRLDAVKHFPDFASEDFLYNLQSNAGWASGGATMYAVGEWVGSSGQMDGWVANVNNRSGTFDFSLRNGLYQMVSQGGNYTGWNTGSELAPHIDPFDPRLSAAYAAALALDGSPMLYFEDVFNVGNTGKRYCHSPKKHRRPAHPRRPREPGVVPPEPALQGRRLQGALAGRRPPRD